MTDTNDEARSPSAFVTKSFFPVWRELLEAQWRTLDNAIDALVRTHRIAGEITGDDFSVIETIHDVLSILSARIDPESELQLRELVLKILDRIEEENEEERLRDSCNKSTEDLPPECDRCGLPHPESDRETEVLAMVRASCDDFNETSDPHGPKISHWFCPSCDSYMTVEKLEGPP